MHDNQLNRYIESVNTFYDNEINKKTDFKKVFVFLTAHDEVPNEDQIACEQSGFIPYTLMELRKSFGDVCESGNELFDEFWFKYLFFDRGANFTKEYVEENFEYIN